MKRCLVSAAIGLSLAASAATAEDKSKELAFVYDDVTRSPTKLRREAKKIYASKFRIVELTQKDGFAPPRIKGYDYKYWAVSYTGDPRLPRYGERPPNVICLFIVAADGRVVEPRVIGPASQGLANAMIKSIAYRRFFPARFGGTTVASLASFEAPSNIGGSPDDKSFRDGLNVMGYRDR